jgi:hypothetical protein
LETLGVDIKSLIRAQIISRASLIEKNSLYDEKNTFPGFLFKAKVL